MKAAIIWYKNNEIVANPETFRLMFLGLTDYCKLCIDINGIAAQKLIA